MLYKHNVYVCVCVCVCVGVYVYVCVCVIADQAQNSSLLEQVNVTIPFIESCNDTDDMDGKDTSIDFFY